MHFDSVITQYLLLNNIFTVICENFPVIFFKSTQIIFVLFSGAYNGDKDYANCRKVKWNKDVSNQY